MDYGLQASKKMANIWNSDHALADEGSFYVATSPTPGTGIATTTSVIDDAATASATHAQNVPVLYIQNTADRGNDEAETIYLKYLRMIVTAAPTSATEWNASFRADSVARYTSGGSLIDPVNINLASPNDSGALVRFGAVVTADLPSSSARLVGRAMVQSSIPVVKDQWIFTFGDPSMPTNLLTATGAKNINIPMGPIIIPPGWNIAMGMWGASNAGAPAWEFELGFVKRRRGL